MIFFFHPREKRMVGLTSRGQVVLMAVLVKHMHFQMMLSDLINVVAINGCAFYAIQSRNKW